MADAIMSMTPAQALVTLLIVLFGLAVFALLMVALIGGKWGGGG